jgi:regulator of protease activity HflC (stomatin/prohibitin superfamily)
VPADQVQYLFTNNRDYKDRVMVMAIDRLKAAMGQVNVSSVAEKRGELRDVIEKTLQRDAKKLGVEVTGFLLPDFQYTKSFRDAVNAAAVQKANVETFEYQRQQAEKSALTNKINAEGQANAIREKARGDADAVFLNAQAEAKSIQLKGEATASAIKAQADALASNSKLVDLRKAERWDGKLPVSIYGSAPVPFMNVKEAQ